MSKEDLVKRYDQLELHILELMYRYIDTHNDPMQGPDDYNLDVHSFCILCHAAFEEYIEDITLYSIERIDKEFNSKIRKISYATLCFLHFDEHELTLNNDDKWSVTLNDYLKARISARKTELSKYATQENHGIDVKYLRKLLVPVGIDVPQNAKYLTSLESLKNIRGAYAHSYARNNKPMAPEDARSIAFDVLEMIQKIKNKAINMSYYII